MEWDEVVDFLCSDLDRHGVTLADIRELSARLNISNNRLKNFGTGTQLCLREVLNSFYFCEFHGSNASAINHVIEELFRVRKFEKLSLELRATLLTKLKIQKQSAVSPTDKNSSVVERSEIDILKKAVAELQRKVEQSNDFRAPTSPRPPTRQKQSSSSSSPSIESPRFQQIDKVLLDHEANLASHNQSLVKVSKLCYGAFGAIEGIETRFRLFENARSEDGSRRQTSDEELEGLRSEIRSNKSNLNQLEKNIKASDLDVVINLKRQMEFFIKNDETGMNEREKIMLRIHSLEKNYEDVKGTLDAAGYIEKEECFESGRNFSGEEITTKNFDSEMNKIDQRISKCESLIEKRISNAELAVRLQQTVRKECKEEFETQRHEMLKDIEGSFNNKTEEWRKDLETRVLNLIKFEINSRMRSIEDDLKKTQNQEFEKLNSAMKEIENMNNIAHQDVSEITKDLQSAKRDISKLSETNLRHTKALTELRKEFDNVDVFKLALSVNSLSARIENAVSNIQQCNNNIEAMESFVKDHINENKGLREDIMQKINNIHESNENQITKLKKEITEEIINANIGSENSLKSEIEFCRKELSSCQEDVTEMQKDIFRELKLHKERCFTSNVAPLKIDIDKIKKKMLAMENDLTNTNNKLIEKHDENAANISEIKNEILVQSNQLEKKADNKIEDSSKSLQSHLESYKDAMSEELANQKLYLENMKKLNTLETAKEITRSLQEFRNDELNNLGSELREEVDRKLEDILHVIKTELDEFKLSEKSKYTLIDKKIKEINALCENMTSSMYKNEEDVKDIRIDLSVDTKAIEELSKRLDANEEDIAQKVESLPLILGKDIRKINSESVEQIQEQIRDLSQESLTLKSSFKNATERVEGLESQYIEEFDNIRTKLNALILFQNKHINLSMDLQNIDDKLFELEKTCNEKVADTKAVIFKDMEETQGKIFETKEALNEVDSKLRTMIAEEFKSKGGCIEDLLKNATAITETNFTRVMKNIKENQDSIKSLRDTLSFIRECESEGRKITAI